MHLQLVSPECLAELLLAKLALKVLLLSPRCRPLLQALVQERDAGGGGDDVVEEKAC